MSCGRIANFICKELQRKRKVQLKGFGGIGKVTFYAFDANDYSQSIIHILGNTSSVHFSLDSYIICLIWLSICFHL